MSPAMQKAPTTLGEQTPLASLLDLSPVCRTDPGVTFPTRSLERTGPCIGSSTYVTARVEIKGWGFYLLSSVSEITLEDKPFRYKACYSKGG